MKITIRPLVNARKTGERMHRMIKKYYTDMAPWASYTLLEIYEKIKNIPFQDDPPGVELIKRPLYTMLQIGPGGDCDDLSICLCSWAALNSIPYHLIAVGRRKDGVKAGKLFGGDKILLTHVFPILKIGGNWIIADATYNLNTLGRCLGHYDRIEVLGPNYARPLDRTKLAA